MSAIIVARSCYSFGYGVETPSDIACAAPPGAAGVLLADSGGLHGQHEFQAAAPDGMKPGAGCRISPGVVLASLEGGWAQLSSLVTAVSSQLPLAEAFSSGTDRLAALVSRPGDALALAEAGFSGALFGAVLPACFGNDPGVSEASFTGAGIVPAACWPVVSIAESSRRAHRLLRAASAGSSEASLPSRAFASRHASMPGDGALERQFTGLRASREGAALLASRLDAFHPHAGLLLSAGDAGSVPLLRSMAEEAFRRTYGNGMAARRRLETELSAIAAAGLAGYFLAFREVAEFCAARGISATARGSAAGSMVSYLLGISGVCPLRCGLSFSRFFNPQRPDPPDIDLDIDSARRDEVVSFVLGRWGRESACVGEIVRHRRSSAFRCAASAAGLGPSDIDSMSVLLDDRDAAVWRRDAGRRLLADAALLEGLPSHVAPHPCGIVISPRPVCEVVPLSPGTSGQAVTQFDMVGVERAGLLKMDLLGQRGLTAISLALGWDARGGQAARGGMPHVPGDIRDALELMASGRTIGVAHVESPALRGLLTEMRVASLDDVARALALVRPGASGSGTRERFFAAMKGEARPEWEFDELRDILGGSFGEMLYEEDVSECAARLLGIDEGQGDLVRRRLKRKRLSPADLEAFGVEGARASAVHAFLSRFAGYGFCRAHAYSYAAIACISASLKASSPACFMAAVLAGGGGFYDQRTYVEEARRLGLAIAPPGVNSGEWCARPSGGGVMLGFSSLRGMGPSEHAALVRGRPYDSPGQVVAAGVGRGVVKAMAQAGCFGEIGLTRPGALWEMNRRSGGFFTREEEGLPGIPEHCRSEMVSLDLEFLGAAVTCSPLSLVDRPDGTVPLDRLTGAVQSGIWGRVASRRSLSEGAGFLMLEDDRGYADVFLPSPLYSQSRLISRREGATVVLRVAAGRDGRLRATSVSAGPLTPCRRVV
ncbi:MAG: hypothetical protein QUS11_04805 [Candidatus Fermentibacter sp.]|nr:hypothetical protein [Candidatus Fermentibacter sp.]